MRDKTILITRPLGDEKTLTDKLHYLGYRVIHEPLTSIFLYHQQRQLLENALNPEPDAIIVTSRHGIAALSILTEVRDILILCVGEATEKTAISHGFLRTCNTGGTVGRLINYVKSGYDPDARFIYVSAAQTREDVKQKLEITGMNVDHIIAYEAVASEQLSDILLEQIKRQQVDAVTFMSIRSAHIFIHLVEKAHILDCIPRIQSFCLSKAIAESIGTYPFTAIHIAEEPTLASLVQSVDNALRI